MTCFKNLVPPYGFEVSVGLHSSTTRHARYEFNPVLLMRFARHYPQRDPIGHPSRDHTDVATPGNWLRKVSLDQKRPPGLLTL